MTTTQILLYLAVMLFHAKLSHVKAFSSTATRQIYQTKLYSRQNAARKIPRRIGIVGGGLAGLSVAYHLLNETRQESIQITVLDKASGPGVGGASAVAGGLVHPLSPRGKIVLGGEEALDVTSNLIAVASRHSNQVVLRHLLYRLALSDTHVKQLIHTANNYPHFATWKSQREILEIMQQSGYCLEDDKEYNTTVLGGLELSNGCQVIHVPTYLQSLWLECQSCAKNLGDTVEWDQVAFTDDQHWEELLSDFEAVVYAAGSGLFRPNGGIFQNVLGDLSLPVELVRGQSVELDMPSNTDATIQSLPEAFLCGKYVTPTPTPNRILIGATHEYKDKPLSSHEVIQEIRHRTPFIIDSKWETSNIHRVTSGWRVQSNRGAQGRLPIIGQLPGSNSWIFTGLSSRGLLYHGIYGKLLSQAIFQGTDEFLLQKYPHLAWWR